jgi:hypothetical protein
MAMTAFGPDPTLAVPPTGSADLGKPENICSARALRVMTPSRPSLIQEIHALHGICGVLTSKPNAKDHTTCGIAGWVSYDGDLRAHQDVIRAMTETMARRGPDAGGVWIDRHVGLGHRRLAVIDRAAACWCRSP